MIDWNDNAKAAVECFAEWAKLSDNGLLGEFDKYMSTAQTKTVADAVEAYPNGWPKHMDDELWFSETENSYMRRIEVLPKHKAYFVCDYLQFEAYVKEQEGEKWTHTHSGVECRIKIDAPDCDGYLVVITKAGRYLFCKPDELKPIKPTISKAQAWDKIYDSIHDCGDAEFAFNSIVEQYDII